LIALTVSRYRIVLCDLKMPWGDRGSRMIQRFREWEAAERPGQEKQPVFAMTAHVDAAVELECLECGMDLVLEKPIDVNNVMRLAGCPVTGPTNHGISGTGRPG
jgi:CheY-like chemotaxis protein